MKINKTAFHQQTVDTVVVLLLLPVRLWEEQTNSTFSGSWMLVMLTVPLQGCWETCSSSFPAASPDSKFLSCLSLETSASRAERFSPVNHNDRESM